jgi:hypothetical protein
VLWKPHTTPKFASQNCISLLLNIFQCDKYLTTTKIHLCLEKITVLLYIVYRAYLQVNYNKPTIMRKIHKVIFTFTLSLHVSMGMPSSSQDTKCYRYQSIKKCRFFLHASNLVYNKKLRNEQQIDVKLINYSLLRTFRTKTQSLSIYTMK